jgi:hypothetical protein
MSFASGPRSVHEVLRRALCIAALVAGVGAGQTVYVDPVNGNDVTGTGSASAPYQTITMAVSIASPTVLLDVQLAPGLYDDTLETFPIVLPPAATFTAPWPGAARVERNAAVTGWLFMSPPGSWQADFDGINFRTADSCIRADAANMDNVTLTATRCRFQGAFGVRVDADGGGVARGFLTDCKFVCTTNHALAEATNQSAAEFVVDRCRFDGGTNGIELHSDDTSAANMTMNRSSVANAARLGVWVNACMASTWGGNNSVTLQHCVFYNCGHSAVTGAGAVGHATSCGAFPVVWIVNCAFDQNLSETPNFNVWYTIFGCVAQSAGVAAAWGASNVSGSPMFIAPGSGDFHLRPGSACIDVGVGHPISADLDDDPYFVAAPSDAGVDEFYAPHVSLRQRNITMGANGNLNFTGPAGWRAWLLVGTSFTGSWGSGLQVVLGSPPVIIPMGTLPAGAGTTQMSVSFTAPTVGSVAFLLPTQAAFDDPSTGASVWGLNQLPILLVP